MSGADYFSDEYAINPYMDSSLVVDNARAVAEHTAIMEALKAADVSVTKVAPPPNCQDGVYTANWGLTRGNKVVLSSLPNKRQAEEAAAKKALTDLGFTTIEAPYRFSGQGDALPCGNLVFMGSHYRTDPRMHDFVAQNLGYEVVSLQTVPEIGQTEAKINEVTGWPDGFFYDLDLALSVLTPNLIAWCPQAFTPESQARLRALDIQKIEVTPEEAVKGFACNLVSTGEVVIMSANAPLLQAAIEAHGLKTVTPTVSELAKGGGYIRCVSLTLDNA